MITHAAKKMNLKYHTAKSIIRVYRIEHRDFKIQKKADKSKYLSDLSLSMSIRGVIFIILLILIILIILIN